jgi:rare lipoprotein A
MIRAAVPLLALLAGCGTAPPARFVVGEPYRLGGAWSYPREDFSGVETGLATRHAVPGWNARTANGEAWSDGRVLAAHRTLQLPAVVAVTNLENGRTLLVRVNDRGPASPGRVIGLSERAMALLGIPAGQTAQVRVAVDGERSRILAEAAPPAERPALPIEAAPRASVAAESLDAPPGARSAAPARAADPVRPAASEAPAAPPRDIPLPETVAQGSPRPGRILVEAGTLSGQAAAARLAARVPGARVEAFGAGRDQQFRVRVGPFANVSEADAALERTLAAGVSGARILVD